MGAQAHTGLAGKIRHALQVALEGIEVDEEGWCVDISQRLAQRSWRVE